MKKKLTNIDKTKKFLNFLEWRFESESYRGNHYSQHGRYDIVYILNILNEINEEMLKQNINKLQIRTTDISKRKELIPGEESYAKIVSNLTKKIGKTTQDSLRKQYFVEMNRMGLIHRYDHNGKYVPPFRQKPIKYISLTELGKEFLYAENDLKRQIIFQECLDRLFKGLTHKMIYYILEINKSDKSNKNSLNYIEMDEYTLFLSFVDNFLVIDNEKIYQNFELIKDYIIEYRQWSKQQKSYLIERIKEMANPKREIYKKSNKKEKKDWHNLTNETQQIFHLLDQTAIFTFDKITNKLYIQTDNNFFNKEDVKKLKRNLIEKENYFKNHNISKKKGYELHHIVPLLKSRNKEEFFLLDKWENMIYIDGKNHSIITQNKSQNIFLYFDNLNILLKKYDEQNDDWNKEEYDKIMLKFDENVIYNEKNKGIMKKKNEELLKNLNWIFDKEK